MKKYKLELTGKLVDGTPIVVEADTLAENAPVFVIDAEGNKVPAPDGEHQLEGGPTIVTVDGKITEIKEVEEPEVSIEVETKEEVKMAIDVEALANQVAAIEAALSAAMIKISELEKVKEEMAQIEVKMASQVAPEVKSEPKKMTYRETILSKIG